MSLSRSTNDPSNRCEAANRVICSPDHQPIEPSARANTPAANGNTGLPVAIQFRTIHGASIANPTTLPTAASSPSHSHRARPHRLPGDISSKTNPTGTPTNSNAVGLLAHAPPTMIASNAATRIASARRVAPSFGFSELSRCQHCTNTTPLAASPSTTPISLYASDETTTTQGVASVSTPASPAAISVVDSAHPATFATRLVRPATPHAAMMPTIACSN